MRFGLICLMVFSTLLSCKSRTVNLRSKGVPKSTFTEPTPITPTTTPDEEGPWGGQVYPEEPGTSVAVTACPGDEVDEDCETAVLDGSEGEVALPDGTETVVAEVCTEKDGEEGADETKNDEDEAEATDETEVATADAEATASNSRILRNNETGEVLECSGETKLAVKGSSGLSWGQKFGITLASAAAAAGIVKAYLVFSNRSAKNKNVPTMTNNGNIAAKDLATTKVDPTLFTDPGKPRAAFILNLDDMTDTKGDLSVEAKTTVAAALEGEHHVILVSENPKSDLSDWLKGQGIDAAAIDEGRLQVQTPKPGEPVIDMRNMVQSGVEGVDDWLTAKGIPGVDGAFFVSKDPRTHNLVLSGEQGRPLVGIEAGDDGFRFAAQLANDPETAAKVITRAEAARKTGGAMILQEAALRENQLISPAVPRSPTATSVDTEFERALSSVSASSKAPSIDGGRAASTATAVSRTGSSSSNESFQTARSRLSTDAEGRISVGEAKARIVATDSRGNPLRTRNLDSPAVRARGTLSPGTPRIKPTF